MDLELCDKDFIIIANNLGNSELAENCSLVLFALEKNIDINQEQIIRLTELSISSARDALHFLRGALLIEMRPKGRSSIYRLTVNGIRIVNELKKLKDGDK